MIGRSLQCLAARAARLAPSPPARRALSSVRAPIAAALVDERRDDIAGARGDPDRAPALAEELVAELRRRVVAQAPAWLRLAADLDARLPTDEDEYMDRPEFDEASRTRTLAAIDRWSRRFGSWACFAAALEPLLDGGGATVLDLASGHGGFALALPELLPRHRLRVIATDLREEYVALGRARARPEVEFRVVDARRLGEHFPPGTVDVVTCTQSLHHFGAGGTASLLAEAVRCARRGVLFVDLSRSLSHLALISAMAVFATGDRSVIHDTALSFRKAFVPEELALIAACVEGGDRLQPLYLPPGFAALRTPRRS